MKKAFKIIGIGLLTLVVILIILGTVGPDASVYPGRQIPKKFLKTIRSLNLLSEGEQIQYFYSDAIVDIKRGLYFVTDQKLVLYSSEWEDPAIIIPLNTITALDPMYDESFLEDTSVYISTSTGAEFSFPVSSEKGLDKRFVEVIRRNMNVEP